MNQQSDQNDKAVSLPLEHFLQAVVKRNDRCICQSGKKYKKCCLGLPVKTRLERIRRLVDSAGTLRIDAMLAEIAKQEEKRNEKKTESLRAAQALFAPVAAQVAAEMTKQSPVTSW